MSWIIVRSGAESTDRYLRADAVREVRVVDQKNITVVDDRGNSYVWKTTGTIAEYGKLAQVLGLTDVA